MTHNEFISRTHFMADGCGVVLSSKSGRNDTLIPAGNAVSDAGRKHRYNAALAKLQRMARDAQVAKLNAKLDRTVELIAARRSAPIPSHEGAGPSAAEAAARWAAEYSTREARICADAKAAYDARNPHKRKAESR